MSSAEPEDRSSVLWSRDNRFVALVDLVNKGKVTEGAEATNFVRRMLGEGGNCPELPRVQKESEELRFTEAFRDWYWHCRESEARWRLTDKQAAEALRPQREETSIWDAPDNVYVENQHAGNSVLANRWEAVVLIGEDKRRELEGGRVDDKNFNVKSRMVAQVRIGCDLGWGRLHRSEGRKQRGLLHP